ncbi:arca-like protein [Diplodia corticola]|uniref:Arca-like protein n=1 Tax=Diplodia corticola TaxID=236234 RepID=A0A1J9RVA5_9PEZI|nr:arca-like protein [Diplodia corticola]OJD32327.1 arca-like protein [Diplodia corticola]
MRKRLRHRQACDECNRRHIKCDGKGPACSPCIESGSKCVPTIIGGRFRHDHNPTVHASDAEKRRKRRKYKNQIWVQIPPHLVFIKDGWDGEDPYQVAEDTETTPSRLQEPEQEDSGQPTQAYDYRPESDQSVEPREISPADPSCVPYDAANVPSLPLDGLPQIQAVSLSPDSFVGIPWWLEAPPDDHDQDQHGQEQTTLSDDVHFESASDFPGLWPLRNPDEARLLCYFVTDLSHWFDFCSKDRHFATTVIQASSTCETLLNAIFAVSAKHLSISGNFDRLASDQYMRKCLQTLIPALNDRGSILETTLFAATAILRLFDEMSDVDDHRQNRGHILGTHILLRAREEIARDSGLRIASLLVTLRQEIFISFLTRTPVQPLANFLHLDRTTAPADDDTWAARVIALSADIVTFCYGPGGRSAEEWQRLHDHLERWEREKPLWFRPVLYVKEGDSGGPFPKIWFSNDSHIGAQLYSDVCRILLLVHDPSLPALGLDREIAVRHMDERVRGWRTIYREG